MQQEIIIHYNGKKLDNKPQTHIASLGLSIVKLGLREGDKFKSLPFNYFDDENTKYKPESTIYQEKTLRIQAIDYTFLDRWNGNVKTMINIHLFDF